MPVYEYICQDCRKRFEIVETVARHETKHVVRCPKCSSKQVERCWSSVYVETAKKS